MSGKTSYMKKRKLAFKYAGNGVKRLVGGEAHAKIHLIAAVLVVVFGFLLQLSLLEWCIVILCIGGVFMAEAFNTAIEKLADRISRENDPLIGTAKDVAAGGVLLMSIAAAIVGVIIFLPKLIQYFN